VAQMTQTLADAGRLVDWVRDARRRTLELVSDLDDEQLMGPRLDVVNPLLWEIGHLAWFQEKFALRAALGRDPIRPDADELWDSMEVAHDTRWDLPLPGREETVAFMRAVEEEVVEALETSPTEDLLYHALYTVFHEDMHAEAFTYTRQTCGWAPPPAPEEASTPGETGSAGPAAGDRVSDSGGPPAPGEDAPVPGTDEFWLGAPRDAPFAFDNEQWAHPLPLEPFRISRTLVTQGEFAEFVKDDGYRRDELWSEAGRAWREDEGADRPLYWRREEGRWLRRHFDRWVELERDLPMVHVNWFEARAYCRWAGRRLPGEAEWEAAAGSPAAHGELSGTPGDKLRFPWGDDELPGPARANVGGTSGGCTEAARHAAGRSPHGCLDMIGQVWEWTASDFRPYPDFAPDPYEAYSEPWFGDRKVLRGGSWATPFRYAWNTLRNYMTPDRRDIFAGFRTCPR